MIMENEIYDRLTKGIRKPRVHKIAVLICGAPGTGKTTNEKRVLNDANIHTQIVLLNADDVIKFVNDRKTSIEITKNIAHRLIDDGYSFIWQASCRFPNAKLRFTEKLKHAGYNVVMAITFASLNIAVERVLKRTSQAPIAESIVRSAHKEFSSKGHVYLEDPNIDELYLYNNDESIKLIYERKNNIVFCYSPDSNFYFEFC